MADVNIYTAERLSEMARSLGVLARACNDRMEEELGKRTTVVVTGGMAQFIAPLCRRKMMVEKDLLLKGLYAIYKKDNYERVRPALDAYTRARKIILNHGKGGTLVDSE